MKKKHRDIVVNDIKYGYVVRGDGKERHVSIYRNNKPIYGMTWRVPAVTPKDIADIIIKMKL